MLISHAGCVRIAIVAISIVASVRGAGRVPGALDRSTQLVFVTTANWNAVDGTLHLYERTTPRDAWRSAGVNVPVVVGRNGLAWGTGLHGQAPAFAGRAEPVKKEGDGKAPAGVFPFSATFGYAPDPVQDDALPYIHITPTLECVDDPGSAFYNSIVDRATTSGTWRSAEQMQRSDGLYKWGIVVEYNANPAVPGAGSCVFLHIWPGPGKGTVGCTAMPEADLTRIMAWLDPKKHPVLVQLSGTDVNRYKAKWGLPDQ